MSAFLCSPEHVGGLAEYSAAHREWAKATGHDLAQLWAKANLASVARRYEMTEDAVAQEFGGFEDAQQYVWACQQQATRNALWIRAPKAEIHTWAFKMASCLDYQSCEVPDWNGSEAQRQIEAVQHEAAKRGLPGYEAAPWELRSA